MKTRRFHFWSALAGGVVAALVASALPAIAAQVGDPFGLGQVNAVNAQSVLRGNVDTSNLLIRNLGDGVPLDLRTNANGRPPMKVDSRRLVRNLNADQLDFRDANELIRTAFGSTNDHGFEDGIVVAASITAPKPGILVMGASINARIPADGYVCSLYIGDPSSTLPGTERRSGEEHCSTDGATVVTAGTYTVNFRVKYSTIYLGQDFEDASVWVIWVPFDGDGNVPIP